jgi:5-dehydro-2-deoxygluconokinase
MTTLRSEPDLDIICLGRAAVDLYGDQIGTRLEDVQSFSKYLGGSPGNTAFGCARLGLRAAMLTRVGDEHNGRFVRETLAQAGVDVSQVITDPKRLTGLVFLAIRDRETFPLVFYRDRCADMALSEADIDPHFIARSRALLISGTHLSTPSVYAASVKAMRAARAIGAKVVLDIDYRPVLWGLTALDDGEQRFVASDKVSAHLQTVLPLCDLIVGTEEELLIAGGAGSVRDALIAVRRFTDAVIVLKRGPQGCVVYDGAIPEQLESGVLGPGFPVEVFNVLGAGDSFMAGFLRGWLRDEPLARCCEWGNACGAITVSRHGCAPAMATWPELQWFLDAAARGFPSPRLWTNVELEHIHHATTRVAATAKVAILECDDRIAFETIARDAGTSLERITAFKALVVRAAIEAIARSSIQKGVLLDDRYGEALFPSLTGTGLWVGRSVNDVEGDLGSALRTWPKHHVAVCRITKPREQIDGLRTLQQAARSTEHEWVLALDATIESIATIDEIYSHGLRPDAWALSSAHAEATLNACLAAIARHDPYCRGVFALDENTLLRAVAIDWMVGAIDDDAAVQHIRRHYETTMNTTRNAA